MIDGAPIHVNRHRASASGHENKISFDKNKIIVIVSEILMDPGTVRKKEREMFSVSEKASEMIKEFLKNRTEAPSIRVLMQEGG